MRNEKQVCTMWQSMQLHNLGIEQKSIWYWQKMREPVIEGCATERLELYANVGNPISDSVVSTSWAAFTAAELSELLPQNLPCIKKDGFFRISANKKDFPFPQIEEGFHWVIIDSDFSEAEVKAEMLIKLLTHGFAKAIDCNIRLLSE